jgi:hypothetical protein
VLVLVPITDAFGERPEAALSRALPDTDAGRAIREALDELGVLAHSLAGTDPAERLRSVARAGSAFTSAWRRASDQPEPEMRNPLLEDGILPRVVTAPHAAVASIEHDLVAALAPHVAERAEHVRLRSAFVALFGTGGTCSDVGKFLSHVPPLKIPNPARRDFPSRPALAIAVLAQLASDEDGMLVAVINQLHTGGGTLYARFLTGDGEMPARARSELRAWIERLTEPRIPIDVPVCGECNPLQAHPRLCDRVLVLPGEPCTSSDAVRLDQTSLVDDPASETMELRGPDGEALVPMYLGATLLSEASGAAYWLSVIGRPFEVQRVSAAPPAPVDAARDVVYLPRRCVGRIVLQRATWWVRSDRLRAHWFRAIGAARLLEVAGEVVEHELPTKFFARRPVDLTHAHAGSDAKPLWVDTENPFCLDLLERFVGDSNWMAFVELWPEPARAWPPSEGEPHVTELLLEVAL